MGSPQGLILANVFLMELKNTLVHRLHKHVNKWRRYVDHYFAYDKNGSIGYVLQNSTCFTLI